jgi:hypothetical protein
MVRLNAHYKSLVPHAVLVLSFFLAMLAHTAMANVDTLTLGDAACERDHAVVDDHSEIIQGGLDQPARRLLPTEPVSIDGGKVAFTLKIDPQRQNYITVKLWGSDKGAESGRLLLFAEGLQVGYRHEGDYDVLNQCDDEGECPGRFLYQTVPLPISMTRGKTSIALEIRSLGPMWGYGTTFAQYQKNLTQPTRGIYRVYSHTESRFIPDASEKQGEAKPAATRPAPGEEVIAKSVDVVNGRLAKLLASPPVDSPANEVKTRAARFLLLGEAYNTPWTPAYHDPRTIDQIVRDGDSMARDCFADAKYISKDWPGAGPMGEAIINVWPAIEPKMHESLEIGTDHGIRGQVWAKVLRSSVDYWRTHRRDYTNQSMIVDRNIYTANRALQLISPGQALPEERTRHYLYQAVGLEPWLGSDVPENGADTGVPDAPSAGVHEPFGKSYYLVTRKGLTRELGFVATYGETILHFTHDIAQLTGDENIRQQLRKLESARMYFRYPAVDADGYRCMKLASEVDNRTAHYPLGGAAYTAPNIREEWWMDVPALLSDDPISIGAAQRSLDDNQYFARIEQRLNDPDTLGMMRNVDEYKKVKSLPSSSYQFPMCDGQPDFAWADEQDAIIAIKHGNTRLFVNLYYRAERGVNGVARILELTPTISRIATVRTEFQVSSTGQFYTRPDWIDGIRSKGMPPPGQDIHQAYAGEKLPIAPRPTDAKLPKYGDFGPFVGKAEHYRVQYGSYLIQMNCSETRQCPIDVPADFAGANDLVSGKQANELSGTSLKPLSTVVLYTPTITR